MTVLIIIGVLFLISYLIQNGSIKFKRKAKIKLNEEGKKYYAECERLLDPFYADFRDVYNEILSDVESELYLLLNEVYTKVDKNTEIYAIAKVMNESTNENKYHLWAVDRICRGLKEIQSTTRGCLYNSQEKYKKISNRLFEEQERTNGN